MRVFNLFIFLMMHSCTAVQKEKTIERSCGNNFYQKIERVSFDKIGQIRDFSGGFIEIEGVFHHYFEDSSLYPSNNSHSVDALWLNLKMPDSLLDKLNKKKVRVIGRVNLSRKGHLGGYLASLDSTFCLKEIDY